MNQNSINESNAFGFTMLSIIATAASALTASEFLFDQEPITRGFSLAYLGMATLSLLAAILYTNKAVKGN